MVEVFDLHFVTGFGQSIDGATRHGVASTVRKRVGYNNETLHGVNDRGAAALVLANVKVTGTLRQTCGINWTVRDILDTNFSWRPLAA